MAVVTLQNLKDRAAAGNLFKIFQQDLVDTFEALGINDLQAQINAITGNINEFVLLADEKSSGTQGGDFVAGARRVRTLNTIYKFPSSLTWCSLAANQWTISANGRYLIIAAAPAVSVDRHRAAIYNATDLVDEPGLFGSGVGGAIIYNDNQAIIMGGFEVTTAPKTYQLEHECSATKLTTGFGIAKFLGTERYSQAIIARLDL